MTTQKHAISFTDFTPSLSSLLTPAGVSITALNNANYFVESLTTQWKSTVADGGEGLPTVESIDGIGEDSPDSWIAKSEYTRTRQMQDDIVKWVTMQLKKLSGREKLVQAEVSDLRLQVAAVEDHLHAGLRAQEVGCCMMSYDERFVG